MHFYEGTLIDTKDGIQCKVYANKHPKGMVVVKPKYIPEDFIPFVGLKKRFLFSRCMNRFNLFNNKKTTEQNLKLLREKLPDYFYECPKHHNWFLVVPKNKIKKAYDHKGGLKELMKVPLSDLDPYLKAVHNLVELILQSGITLNDLGISHSTLLGNYTPGRSDIDILVYGKENGWKVINFLGKNSHPSLKWKAEEDWAKYYHDRIVSKQFSEKEYVFNMARKRDDGFFEGHVFSIFCLEEKKECWYNWKDEHEPLATVKLTGTVKDAYNSIVRPGYYELQDTQIISGYENVPIKRIVTWSRPFNLQAKNGERVEACGLLEKVKAGKKEYYQVVIGYFDTYTTDRGEQEYLKVLVE